MFRKFKDQVELGVLKQLQETPDETTMIVDVRQPEEYREYRLKGSINIPINTLEQQLDHFQGKERCLVHCAHGLRATKACHTLKRHFPEKIIQLIPFEIEEWENLGLDTLSG